MNTGRRRGDQGLTLHPGLTSPCVTGSMSTSDDEDDKDDADDADDNDVDDDEDDVDEDDDEGPTMST